MTYTGNVHVGGDPAVRELTGLVVEKLAVGAMNNNAYLLRCRETGDQLLVDAAAEPERLLDLVGPDGLVGIVTTHQHWDHWTGLADVVAATAAPTYAHAEDAPGIDVPTAHTLADGEVLRFGKVELRVIHLVGHTPGSIALVYDDPDGPPHVWTGDCLFPGGPGNTRGDSAAFESLLDGLEDKVFGRFPDETWVYPGHGDDTTLGAERPHLAEWRARGW